MSTLDKRLLESIVAAACRAPSVHNSQPWRWRYLGDTLDLFADWDRQVKHTDPAGRDLEISCGAALHHAVIAANGEGYQVRVGRLPTADDRAHLASMHFALAETGPVNGTAYRAIFDRYTDRRRPSSLPVPREWLDELTGIGARHGALVTPLRDRYDEEVARDLRQVAALLQHDSEEYLEELGLWTGSSGNEGVPYGSVVAQPIERLQPATETRFTTGLLRDNPSDGEAPAPSWLLLATSSDDSLSRLRAGEALSAMLLKATVLGLCVVPYTQPVEVDATRRRLEERLLGDGASLQVLLRVAMPPSSRPRVAKTRRRPVADVLDLGDEQHVAS